MTTLSRVGEIVRRHDPDRFFTALFAPADRREALFTLYAFNHELARAREVAREPMIAMIRLQWWREVVEGASRRHEVADPLRDALDAGLLHRADLLGMIEGREMGLDPLDDPAEWSSYVEAMAGGVAVAAGRSLGAGPESLGALRDFGSAYGAAGLRRNAGAAAPPWWAERGLAWLEAGRRVGLSRSLLPAALPAVYAARDLRRSTPVRERGAGDRFAVIWAVARGGFRSVGKSYTNR